MYVGMSLCMYVCINACFCIQQGNLLSMYACTHGRVYACIYAGDFVCTHVWMDVSLYTLKRVSCRNSILIATLFVQFGCTTYCDLQI